MGLWKGAVAEIFNSNFEAHAIRATVTLCKGSLNGIDIMSVYEYERVYFMR